MPYFSIERVLRILRLVQVVLVLLLPLTVKLNIVFNIHCMQSRLLHLFDVVDVFLVHQVSPCLILVS